MPRAPARSWTSRLDDWASPSSRLGIPVEQFGSIALQSHDPAPIAGRCAVFAKTDMIHKAQEGTPLPDILLGLAFALARNYIATLIKGDSIAPVVSLQGGVMSNQAVVHAFKNLLELDDTEIVTPPHFTVLGALGCAALASRDGPGQPSTLRTLRDRAVSALRKPPPRSFLQPLNQAGHPDTFPAGDSPRTADLKPPLVMGLDVGSVSVKGVVVDATARIVREDYRLSRSRPLETMKEVIRSLSSGRIAPALIAVTGSGRHLAGRLIDADLIVNEITAQATAALRHDSAVDTVVEIGGQDSKWISLEAGKLKDFEMNRVCAAGTGSFLMEQADRLGFSMGPEFSDAAFSSRTPADLGNRCTVFMESDLIHHQNNGATSGDLAAGVCVSIVHNYLERVANNKPMGNRVLFLGGVAATPAVRAAFERETRRQFHSPGYYRVSGALGAALKALEGFEAREILARERGTIDFDPAVIRKEQFRCKGCSNRCLVDKYYPESRIVFHGGLCDRWEGEQRSLSHARGGDLFDLRTRLLEEISESGSKGNRSWGMARSPQFFEWFPFWKAFLEKLGISLIAAPRSHRGQFERGLRYLKVETCLPVKIMAGQIADLVDSGIRTIFHPSLLTEQPSTGGAALVDHCPYIQASSQFFKGSFDVDWKEPLISFELDPDSFRKEHLHLARAFGASRREARQAVEYGMERQEEFEAKLRQEGKGFLDSLTEGERGVVVLGKPYHTADSFLNMNLGSLFQRLGVRALPADLYPLEPTGTAPQVSWKYQSNMIRVAREVADIPQLFPVLITFFGCGPDPFTVRHIKEALAGKPILMLEMDEHTSRAGVITRMEAFLERVRMERKKPMAGPKEVRTEERAGVDAARKSEPSGMDVAVGPGSFEPSKVAVSDPEIRKSARPPRAEVLYLPYMADHAYGFAAAARSLGVDTRVLTPPDRESEKLGRPHMVGGECHPYALILGDYLKMAQSERSATAKRALFYVMGLDACRLGQYPTYIEKIRRELGYSIRVISEIDEGLDAFGLSESNQRRVLLRAWEGLNAYDLLMRLFLEIRPVARDKTLLERVYTESRDKLFDALSEGRVRQGMEEALHGLYGVPVDETAPKPVVVVTGDYYTRVVPFANNEVYEEIENLGGVLRAPPTFTDAFKIGPLRDLIWHLVARRVGKAAEDAVLFLYMAASELKVRGGPRARRVQNASLDLLGRRMWKSAGRHAHTRLPAGMTAPIVTTLRDVDTGGDGILNLITLNCAYGTVVTAALSRALKDRPGIPMLTLIFDGLKKTNEKTRLEAFMEQVRDNFKRRTGCRVRSTIA
ncbi:MAG: acyl-CoA dehydratase activase [Deltaproteobacteria bacterium]